MAPQAVPDAPGGNVPPAIRASGLVKTFGTLRAVDDVTFELAPGRIYGLLGPNGSGKTTLIRLLAGLTLPTAGWAEVLGTRMPSRQNLERIGYMTQADGVYTALTVAREPPLLRRGLRRGRRRARGRRARGRRSRGPAGLDRGDALGRPAATPVARLRPHPPAARPVPGRTNGRGGSAPPRRVLGPLPDARRRRDHDRRVEPRHGRGGPLRRAPLRPLRQAHCPGPGGDPRPRRAPPTSSRRSSARRGRGGDPVSRRRVAALFRRVAAEIRRDRPSLALLFIAPILITGLLTFILRDSQAPQVTAVVVNTAGVRGQLVTGRPGARAPAWRGSPSATSPTKLPPAPPSRTLDRVRRRS